MVKQDLSFTDLNAFDLDNILVRVQLDIITQTDNRHHSTKFQCDLPPDHNHTIQQVAALIHIRQRDDSVTKGSKDADFGTTLVSQLFGVPRALYLVGVMLAVLGFVTQLNTILFVGLGLVFIIVARNIEGTIETAKIEQEVDSEEAAAER